MERYLKATGIVWLTDEEDTGLPEEVEFKGLSNPEMVEKHLFEEYGCPINSYKVEEERLYDVTISMEGHIRTQVIACSEDDAGKKATRIAEDADCGELSDIEWKTDVSESSDEYTEEPDTDICTERFDLGSYNIDVEYMPGSGKYDIWLGHTGCSGDHHQNVTADQIGKLVAEYIRDTAECYMNVYGETELNTATTKEELVERMTRHSTGLNECDDPKIDFLTYDIPVRMKKADIIEAYADAEWRKNRYIVGRKIAEDTYMADDIIPEGKFDDIYEGLASTFLRSLNGREEETGLYRTDPCSKKKHDISFF